jgi:3-hydroxybutyryl-CoA dehydrogenase
MKIQTVGVVGAGVMGRGVAQALAQTGHHVLLIDIADEILTRAKSEITANIRVYNLFAKEKLILGANQILANITFSTDYAVLADADFVIENATEKWEIKQPIYLALDSLCPAEAVLAVNTSAIPITRLAALTKRPSKVIGMHFMNPVPLKPTVEVIRGYHTSAATIARANQLLTQMGKDGIVVNDSSGFVTNRVMMLTVNEAIFLLHEQVATAADIDRLFKQCFGHKMGPLETTDLIGLDTVLLSLEVLYENYNDSKYRPCPLLRKMVDAGLYGRKSGQGFYTYLEQQQQEISHERHHS